MFLMHKTIDATPVDESNCKSSFLWKWQSKLVQQHPIIAVYRKVHTKNRGYV